MQEHYDVIVVGGSFAGLSAAMQLARARRRVCLIDAGRPRNRFASHAHGFFGQDGVPPSEVVAHATAQLLQYPTVSLIKGEARKAYGEAGGFDVDLADGFSVHASRLILATGVRDVLPAVPGIEARWGVSVLHCPYCHGYEVGDRQLGVLATHPLSIHQALLIPDWGPTTWFTQGIVEPTAEEAAHLHARGVIVERTPVAEIVGAAPGIDALRLIDGREISIDALFVGARTALTSDLAVQLGCAIDEGPLGPVIRVGDWKETSVAGVFAAGDASSAMTNATFASAAGVAAGVAAHRSLIFPA
ncbi:NAD(P)/FAD-dependent oxidoreductase [Trinickia dinghuensis]|uniref:NAD(P)/FAD-dependent oxidoreductase n=1 Tax=Trinickia dinghuensis TaxID=2291023 RepID=A0A3D8JX26_9BURK|nr:NAD(P)/FAD-dependent oxidoreductase [Trinickia dinghuensis]RDU97693.1 NAD(P)/FAD-dependent oxidoreductase [Trinickia dinghuensis]